MFDGLNMQLFNFIAVCVAGGLFLLLLIYIGFLNYRGLNAQYAEGYLIHAKSMLS